MKPMQGKVLVRFEQHKQTIIIQSKDINKLIGDFYIEKIGSDCNKELQEGQKITLREHYYKIPVELSKENTKNSIYHMLIDQSEIWGVE